MRYEAGRAGVRINIATPVRRGGPYNWGRDLAGLLGRKYAGRFEARHVHGLGEVLSASFYQGADIVHATVPITYRLWRRPVVLTIHGEYTIEKLLWHHMYSTAVRMADAVTVPSVFLKERLGLDGAAVIPNAVFPDRFEPVGHADRAAVNIVTVTKFSFLDKAQGILNLLGIIEGLQKCTDRKVNLTVIGGGKYLNLIIDKSREYGVNVDFKGFVDSPRDHFKGADIFAYYSTHDNFPIAILEGMASGLPVVANDVGAMKEILARGEDGLIAGNDGEYLECLSRLAGDTEYRARLGLCARKKVERSFSWDRVVERYVKVYEQLS